MTDRPPAPGYDEIALSAPPDDSLCHNLAHTRAGRLAVVLVTFGQLGTRWHRDAVFQDCWGRSYPMCAPCWDDTHRVTALGRPALVVHDHRQPTAASPATTGPAADE